MTESVASAPAWLEEYRHSLAPLRRARQESLATADRLARYHYALAGDYLDWNLAQARIFFTARAPVEVMARQAELGTRMAEQLLGRVTELTSLVAKARGTFDDPLAVVAASAPEDTNAVAPAVAAMVAPASTPAAAKPAPAKVAAAARVATPQTAKPVTVIARRPAALAKPAAPATRAVRAAGGHGAKASTARGPAAGRAGTAQARRRAKR